MKFKVGDIIFTSGKRNYHFVTAVNNEYIKHYDIKFPYLDYSTKRLDAEFWYEVLR